MNARILVVEDETIVQLDLQRRLERMGHSVIGTATRGEEAVAKAIDLGPDLILMDVRLEGSMDGIEAARRIRAERDIPVIYVTAYAATLEDANPQELVGPRLSKPFRTTQLQLTISRTLADANRAHAGTPKQGEPEG